MELNFETKVFNKEKIQMGPACEYIVKGGRDKFDRLKTAFSGINQIGVIGWGSQGFAQSQNLKDSLEGTGIRVKVGLRAGSSSMEEARKAGFSEAQGTLGEMMQVISESDMVILLISDAAQAELYPQIFKALKPGATLGFSHGFLVGYLQSRGESFPKNINVVGVCPKGMGLSVRRLYEQGREVGGAGINTSFAVHQDVNGRATDYALAWSVAIGAPYIFMTTLENEYRSDIFGERGILLGAVYGLVESVYRRFISQGKAPEEAYLSTVESIAGPVSAIISKKGLKAVYESFDDKGKAKFQEAFSAAYTPAFSVMLEIYEEVASGNEIISVLLAGKRAKRFPISKIENSPMWQVGKKVRENRDKNKIPVDPFVCGIYLAVMTAQIDVLSEKGHPGSEIANESVIEAVDSLNPFMFAKGLSSMIDNCSVTARLGARKWAPRFHYMLEEEVYPVLDSHAAVDSKILSRFLNHPVHEIIAVCAKLRPSVDIKVL